MSRMIDKRHNPRLKVNLPVVLRHRGRFIPATMLNLSCGGMYLKTDDEDISDDSPVEVIFDLDNERRDLSVSGQIKHLEHADDFASMGIQFSNIFSSSQKVIQDYLKRGC